IALYVPLSLHDALPILITHEHADHVHGLVQLSAKLHVPVYCNRPTQEAFEYQFGERLDCRLFRTRESFEVGDITVESFDIAHDRSEEHTSELQLLWQVV